MKYFYFSCPPECTESKVEPTLREGLELFNKLLNKYKCEKHTERELEYVMKFYNAIFDDDLGIDKIVDLFHKAKEGK